jgi:RNA polymerase sigma-70 factor (ECF subfamily)
MVDKQRDEAAFTRLFEFFAPKIKRFGIKQFKNESQANELVQETMANVWKKAHLFDASKGAATTWVYTVMRNASFDLFRKINNRPEQNLGDDIWPIEQQVTTEQPESLAFNDHLMSRELQKVVNGLPTAQRVVVQGVYFQELSQEQLAKQLGVPIGTIKSRVRLALEKIRQQMGDQDND